MQQIIICGNTETLLSDYDLGYCIGKDEIATLAIGETLGRGPVPPTDVNSRVDSTFAKWHGGEYSHQLERLHPDWISRGHIVGPKALVPLIEQYAQLLSDCLDGRVQAKIDALAACDKDL